MVKSFDFSLLDAPVVSSFRGRTRELEELERYSSDDECSIISVLGMGGMGKSWLARQFVDTVGDSYDVRCWVSLLNAPTWEEAAHSLLRSIDPSVPLDTGGAPNELLRLLHEAVSTRRCLLVLDNFESLMEPLGQRRGHFRSEHAGYDSLLRVLALGSDGHTVLTSRERPVALDAVDTLARSVALRGVSIEEASAIGQDGGLDADLDQWQAVVDQFGGNPQLVKLAAASAIALGGDLGAFLSTRGDQLEGERELFEWHFSRLSSREQSTMYWLAALRSSSSVRSLTDRFHPPLGPSDPGNVDILRRLRDSAIVEWAPPDRISLQPAMLEFVTGRLVNQFVVEIVAGLSDDGVLARQALMIASAPAPIRSSLRQLMVEPIVDGLREALGSPKEVSRHLRGVLDRVRTRRGLHSSYAAGNLCNLLVAVEGDLSNLDFSDLTVRNADLSRARLTKSKMVDAELVDTEIAQTFGNVLAVAASESGGWFAAAGTDNDVWVWDRTGDQHARLIGHSNWVRDLAFNAEGTLLASVSSDGTLRVWDVERNQLHFAVEAHAMRIWSVAWSENGILTASQDHTVKLWSERHGDLIGLLSGHTGPVMAVDAAGSSPIAFSGAGDGHVRSWDLSGCQAIDDIAVGADVTAVRSGGAARVIVGTSDGRIILVPHEAGRFKSFEVLSSTASCVTSLDVDELGALVSTHDDGRLAVWDIEHMRLATQLGGHLSRATSARFRGPDLLVSGGEDQTIRLWNTDRWEMTDVLIGKVSHAWSVSLVDGDDAGTSRLLAGHEDGTVHCWQGQGAKRWTLQSTWQHHHNRVWCVRFDRRSSLAVSASEDGFATVWDSRDGSIISRLGDHHSAVWAADFNACGSKVVTACDDGSLRIWDVRTGSMLRRIEAHQHRIRALACHPEDSFCVSGGEDFALRMWGTESGELIEVYEGHSDRINAVGFDALGQRFVSGGRDGVVASWVLGRADPVWSHQAGEYVWAAATDATGQRVAYGTESGSVYVIDAVPGATPTLVARHRHRVKSLVFSRDSSLLMSCSEDGNVKAIDAAAANVEASFEAPRAYEGLDITGIRGLSEAAVATLIALGAVHRERSDERETAARPGAPSVFISYAREDLDYVRELAAVFEQSRVAVWLDQTGVQHGDSFAESLRAALDDAAAVVVVMSQASARSRWVRREVQYAESSNKPVFPVLLDGDPFFELGDLHFEDVRGRIPPSGPFIERLRAALGST